MGCGAGRPPSIAQDVHALFHSHLCAPCETACTSHSTPAPPRSGSLNPSCESLPLACKVAKKQLVAIRVALAWQAMARLAAEGVLGGEGAA